VHPGANRPLRPRVPSGPFQQRRTVPLLTTRLPCGAIRWQGNRDQSQPAALSQLWPVVRDHPALLGLGAAAGSCRRPGTRVRTRPRTVLRACVADGAHHRGVPRRWGVRDHAGSITARPLRIKVGGSPHDVKVRSENIRLLPLARRGWTNNRPLVDLRGTQPRGRISRSPDRTKSGWCHLFVPSRPARIPPACVRGSPARLQRHAVSGNGCCLWLPLTLLDRFPTCGFWFMSQDIPRPPQDAQQRRRGHSSEARIKSTR